MGMAANLAALKLNTYKYSSASKFFSKLCTGDPPKFSRNIAAEASIFKSISSIFCYFDLNDIAVSLNPAIDTVPRISTNPTLSVSHENSRIVFTCKYDVNSNVKAFNAEVIWYHGSSKKEIQKEMFKPWKGQARLQNKGNSNRNFQLGTFVSSICVEAFINYHTNKYYLVCDGSCYCKFVIDIIC